MADPLKPLMFTVGLIDKISGPANKATQSFQGLVNTAKTGFQEMTAGAMGMAGTGFLIYEGLQPAIEMERALGEIKAIGVHDEALQQLSNTATELSASYGLAASDIVANSALLKQSIGNLSDEEYTSMTEAVSVLAVSTKTGMEDTSKYISQMYHRYQGEADSIGRAVWVDQLVGKTAYLKKTLGVDAVEMADALEGLNNLGSGLGVAMDEQMAVIAKLSQSTGISDAEQQYTAFLEHIYEAQETLGMTFMGANGQLLSMTDILAKLQGKFGDLGGVEAWAELDEAFGDGAKLIQQLSKDTTGLYSVMNQLGDVKGMDEAATMASTMVDPWQKLASGVQAVRIAVGQALLPVLNPLVESISAASREILYWTKLFPNLTRIIGLTAITILAMGATMAVVTIAAGIFKSAIAGLKLMMTIVRSATVLWTGAQWLLNAAFLASPIGLIVIGITALVSVIYAAYKGIMALWDAIKDTGPVKGLVKMLNMIPGVDIDTDTTTEVPALQSTKQNEVPAGGITNQISKSIADNSSTNTTINVTTNEAITPAQIEQMMLMGV